MKKLNFGVLHLASEPRRPDMIYEFSCPGCLGLLAVSSTSAELLRQGGVGVCPDCARYLTIVLSGRSIDEPLSAEYRDRLSKIFAQMLETLEALKKEGGPAAIMDIIT